MDIGHRASLSPRCRSTSLALAIANGLSLAAIGCGTVDDSHGMVTDVKVVINELVPRSDTIVGTNEEPLDWVELHNPSDRAVALQGFYVSDSLSKPLKYALPSDAVLPPNGYLLLWADGIGTEPLHLPFGLGADGEGFVLSDRDGKVIDAVEYPTAAVDEAYARFPNGTGAFSWCEIPSPGKSNGRTCGAAEL